MFNINATNEKVWLVYDGDCPLCLVGAKYFHIKQAVGDLYVLDARQAKDDHSIIQEIKAHGLDLNQGMVLKIGGRLYHGVDALHIMALIGSNSGWFNRLNAYLFKSKKVAKLCYPLLKIARNLALWLKGIPQINNMK
jgi:predicted DCC family thiol-disulfide oxidoreductase YuxK